MRHTGFGLQRLVHILMIVPVQNKLSAVFDQNIPQSRSIPQSFPRCVLTRQGRMMHQNGPEITLLTQTRQQLAQRFPLLRTDLACCKEPRRWY